jgi:L-ascorbate metabolism protein UlaG (beta-lactamase superfamily)
LDEGYYEPVRGRYKLLMESGMYQLDGLQVQGISMAHDRKGGDRFGNNIAWLWTQADIKILHLGGAAAPISLEQEILMGKPDLLFIPVGNGPKAFDPQTAKQAVDKLKPKIIVPTHYLTEAANPQKCDLLPLENFLQLMPDTPVRRIGSDTLNLTAADIPEQQTIQVFEYDFAIS